MKKFGIWLMTAVLALTLTACSSKKPTAETGGQSPKETDVPVVSSEPVTTVSNMDLSSKEPFVVFDEEKVTITLTSFTEEADRWVIQHSVEKHMGETITVKFTDWIVNGTLITNGKVGHYVDDGETKENVEVTLHKDILADYGITTIASFAYGVEMEGQDSYDTYEFTPVTLKGVDAEVTPGTYGTDNVLYDEDGVKLYAVSGMHKNYNDVDVVTFYLVNDSDDAVGIQSETMFVSGEAYKTYGDYVRVPAHTQAHYDVWMTMKMGEETPDWTTVENLEMPIQLFDGSALRTETTPYHVQ